jgi:hypothetical protein
MNKPDELTITIMSDGFGENVRVRAPFDVRVEKIAVPTLANQAAGLCFVAD